MCCKLTNEFTVAVTCAIGELLSSTVFGALELVVHVEAYVEGLFAGITILVDEKPPAHECEHDGYTGYKDADGRASVGDVNFW